MYVYKILLHRIMPLRTDSIERLFFKDYNNPIIPKNNP